MDNEILVGKNQTLSVAEGQCAEEAFDDWYLPGQLGLLYVLVE